MLSGAGQTLERRIDVIAGAFANFEWLDMTNKKHLIALDKRLNQNFFVGRAAKRIETGRVGYLYGRTIWEGLVALVPRFLWPEKPVLA